MNSRLIMFLISVVGLIFIVNISRSIVTLWQRGAIVTEREEVRDKLAERKAELEKQALEVESPEYIEEVAREKLNLQKEGEVVVVLPKDLQVLASEDAVPEVPNWQKWWNLFF